MKTQVSIEMTLEEYNEQQENRKKEIESLQATVNELKDRVDMYRKVFISPMEEFLSKNKEEIHNSSYEELIDAILHGKIKLTAYLTKDAISRKVSIAFRADASIKEFDEIREQKR